VWITYPAVGVHEIFGSILKVLVDASFIFQLQKTRRRLHNVTSLATLKMAKWLNAIALYGKPISELRSVTRRMESHSVACHPTQVNARHLNPSQICRYSIYPSRRDVRLSWPRRLVLTRPRQCNAAQQRPTAVHLFDFAWLREIPPRHCSAPYFSNSNCWRNWIAKRISTDANYAAPGIKCSCGSSDAFDPVSEWRIFNILDAIRHTSTELDNIPAGSCELAYHSLQPHYLR